MTDALASYNVATVQAARATATNTAVGANGLVKFYTGPKPADASVARTGTLLVSGTCSATFGVVTPGVSGGASAYLSANAITMGNGVATGTPGYMTIETSAGVGVIDLDCGASMSGAAVIVSPNTITSGAPVAISSLVITEA